MLVKGKRLGLRNVLTLALGHGGGSIEVGGGVAWAGDAVVLAEVRLVGA